MNERKQNEILERIDNLEHQFEMLSIVHRKLLTEMKRRNDLLDDLLQDQEQDDWWKEGPDTEC